MPFTATSSSRFFALTAARVVSPAASSSARPGKSSGRSPALFFLGLSFSGSRFMSSADSSESCSVETSFPAALTSFPFDTKSPPGMIAFDI